MTDGKIDEVKGRAKEAAGAVTDDDDLKNEGKVDKVQGGLKAKIDDIGDKVKDALKKD